MWLHDLRTGFSAPIADEPADTSIVRIVSPLISLKAQLKSSTNLAWFAPRGSSDGVVGDVKAHTNALLHCPRPDG
ncbi:MAG: hypothetical protein QM813_21455 [Verrucomicrobiota bacterium]